MIDIEQEEAMLFKEVLLKTFEGRLVLGRILEQLGTFDTKPPTDMNSAVLRSYGMQLLATMGITHVGNLELLLEGFNDLPIRGVSANHQEESSGS